MVHINYTFIGRSGFDFKDLEYRTLSLKILIANILQHGVHVTIKKKKPMGSSVVKKEENLSFTPTS